MSARLPDGRTGQTLALLLLTVVLAMAWTAVGAPLVAWHAEREAAVQARRTLAGRMVGVAASLPALQQQAARPGAPVAVPVLEGASDAVAGAELQQKLQDMAARAGATLASAELLAAEPAGAYRRVRLRITLRAPWPVLVGLLQAIASAQPGMVVDDVQVHGAGGFNRAADPVLEASWTVLAFRPGTAA